MLVNKAERRKDTPLRAAIDRILKSMKNKPKVLELYEQLLTELGELTQSPYAFIAEAVTEESHQFHFRLTSSWQKDASLPGIQDKSSMFLSLRDKEPNLMAQVMKTKRAKVFDQAVLSNAIYQQNSNNSDPISFNQLLAIPLIDKQEVYAIVCLVNSPKPYKIEMAIRLWPLTVTATCWNRFNQPPQYNTNPNGWCDTLKKLERLSPIAMITLNGELRITGINTAAQKLFEWHADEVLDHEIHELIPERFPNEHNIRTINSDTFLDSTNRKKRTIGHIKNGKHFPIEITTIQFQENGHKAYLLLVFDKSEIHLIKADHSAELQRFKVVSDLAPIGILQTNAQWEAVYVNNKWSDISGYSHDEIMGMGWVNAIYQEEVVSLLEDLRNTIIEGKEFSTECRFQTPLADLIWVELKIRPLFDENAIISGFVGTLTDVTYRRNAEEKLRNMAERDVLTGLANRILFQDRLDLAIKRIDRHGPFALLCLDLDGFKNINDTLGHDAGDLLLVEVANRLMNCVRQEDTVARTGGDEFMILLEGLYDASVAAEISEEILKALQEPAVLKDQEVFISTSIGITFAVGSKQSKAQNLVKQADIAMYRAKAQGRNNYQYFSPELEEASKTRLLLGNSLHRALERSEFELAYQLQADISNQRITGLEALLRWNHSDKGLIMPNEFIPILEESGLIIPVSQWIWQKAFEDHKRWMDEGLVPEDAHISVNISPRHLKDMHLLSSFEMAMNKSGLEGKNIVIEITETVLLDHSPNIIDVLRNIQKLGVRIALDDFGTGYSSLTYLREYSIDILKIDSTFIQNILTDSEDAAITQGILAMAKFLDLPVIAEGVDSQDKLECLKKWNCNIYQGYLLNKPVSAKNIESMLKYQDSRTA